MASTLKEDEPLPTALNTKSADKSDFDTQLDDAQSDDRARPGDRINLADGDYGTKTISVSGTRANPIVIRSTNHGAVFTQLTITGDWVIVSGVDINNGNPDLAGALTIGGSNVRFTRSLLRNSGGMVQIRAGVTDVLIDHCDIHNWHDRLVSLANPKDQRRITFARCWVHGMQDGGKLTTCHGFSWNEKNSHRETPFDTIVRFCYIGPGFPTSGNADYIHHKGSNGLYAFNRFDHPDSKLLSHRFGLRMRYVGNYAPKQRLNMYDDLGWYYGNLMGKMRAPAGQSAFYDDTRNLHESVGGFHACKRCRLAGNQAKVVLGLFGKKFATSSGHPTLPDPQPAGGVKPKKSFGGVTYAEDDPDHPDVGIKIRAHSGNITEEPATITPTGTIVWVENLDPPNAANGGPLGPAPAAWRRELFAEYPWIEDACPDPTSLTGGPGGSKPWSIAEALTKDGGSPSVGPNRPKEDSRGGLP